MTPAALRDLLETSAEAEAESILKEIMHRHNYTSEVREQIAERLLRFRGSKLKKVKNKWRLT